MVFYSDKHRTICAVIQEIQDLADKRGDEQTSTLCDEAITYARKMQLKLAEYKQKEQQHG